MNIHLKGIYDNIINHIDELTRSDRVLALNDLAQCFNGGELFNLCFFEEIKSMAEHLMGVYSRPKVSIQLANVSTSYRTFSLESQELINRHFVMLPTSKLEDNPFVWDKPELIKIPKFPAKCLDNYSIVSFPEEAFYLAGDLLAKSTSNLFTDLEYPGVPKYYIDPTHLMLPKQELAIKGDSYVVENKSLMAKFKQLFTANPKLKKVFLPFYYYYQYEQSFQMIGYLKYEIYGKDNEFCKLMLKHFPLKFMQMNDIVTEQKSQLPQKMEKLIESLPRYSHNYYFSILKMHNVVELLKKRFKFMFGFSVDQDLTRIKWRAEVWRKTTRSIADESKT